MAIGKEVDGLLKTHEQISGILLVLQTGRCDGEDLEVYQLFLNILFAYCPKTMIGLVVTHAVNTRLQVLHPVSYDDYIAASFAPLQANQQPGEDCVSQLAALMKKKIHNVAYVENPDPQQDGKFRSQESEKRLQSLENVRELLVSFSKSYNMENLKSDLLDTIPETVPTIMKLIANPSLGRFFFQILRTLYPTSIADDIMRKVSPPSENVGKEVPAARAEVPGARAEAPAARVEVPAARAGVPGASAVSPRPVRSVGGSEVVVAAILAFVAIQIIK